MEKYRILEDDNIKLDGKILYRIQSLINFGNVKVGDLGGYVENEANLSHNGTCWIYNNAKVFGCAHIKDSAKVFNNALVYGNAWIHDNAKIYGNSQVYDNAEVYGSARLFDNVTVCNFSKIHGSVSIYGNALIYEFAEIYEQAKIRNHARIHGNAKIHGLADIYDNTNICDNASIAHNSDYITLHGIGSAYGSIVFFKLKDGNIGVTSRIMDGLLSDFEARIKQLNMFKTGKHRKEYLAAIKLAKIHFGL